MCVCVCGGGAVSYSEEKCNEEDVCLFFVVFFKLKMELFVFIELQIHHKARSSASRHCPRAVVIRTHQN